MRILAFNHFNDFIPAALHIKDIVSTLYLSEFFLFDHVFTPRASTVGKVDCDVDESCQWFFIGTVLATRPECIISIQGASKKSNRTLMCYRVLNI